MATLNWSQYLATVYFRIYVRLVAQEKVWRAVDEHLKKYGQSPADPVRVEARRTLDQLRAMRRAIAAAHDALPKPYRPGVDPWRTSGLSARLKGDFEKRGITETEQDRPPLPDDS